MGGAADAGAAKADAVRAAASEEVIVVAAAAGAAILIVGAVVTAASGAVITCAADTIFAFNFSMFASILLIVLCKALFCWINSDSLPEIILQSRLLLAAVLLFDVFRVVKMIM